jgi:CVNH domain
MPDGDSSSSSSYPGAGGGYSGAYGGDRVEYRGTLPSGSYTESCRDMRVDHDRHRLEAECQRLDGRWREAHLDLRECDRRIVNSNGPPDLRLTRGRLSALLPPCPTRAVRTLSALGRFLDTSTRYTLPSKSDQGRSTGTRESSP